MPTYTSFTDNPFVTATASNVLHEWIAVSPRMWDERVAEALSGGKNSNVKPKDKGKKIEYLF